MMKMISMTSANARWRDVLKVALTLFTAFVCSLISSCTNNAHESEIVRTIKSSELHPIGTGCDGAYYKLADGKLISVMDGRASDRFKPEATVREMDNSVIIEFGTDPLFYEWILTPTMSENVFNIESRLKHPLSAEEEAYYKKATRTPPDEINKIWNSFKAFTLCPSST
ncbi:hypothetical protein [Rhizobium phaseoli]|uniref:hypothetical protein n=1 Tax=Rhizobium phaseoli TaxID=396 RepID=UPI000A1DD863|nr:hypothetical protein [Rhizobium phaseoli]